MVSCLFSSHFSGISIHQSRGSSRVVRGQSRGREDHGGGGARLARSAAIPPSRPARAGGGRVLHVRCHALDRSARGAAARGAGLRCIRRRRVCRAAPVEPFAAAELPGADSAHGALAVAVLRQGCAPSRHPPTRTTAPPEPSTPPVPSAQLPTCGRSSSTSSTCSTPTDRTRRARRSSPSCGSRRQPSGS